jgi:hypothetical protein
MALGADCCTMSGWIGVTLAEQSAANELEQPGIRPFAAGKLYNGRIQ